MIRSPLMTVMTDAVMKASRSLKRDFGEVENLQVLAKGPGDFVSKADHKAEEILRAALEKARPGYGFVMEESGVVTGGMIPKLECCAHAVEKGANRAFIIDGRVPHAILIEMLTDEGIGTMVTA